MMPTTLFASLAAAVLLAAEGPAVASRQGAEPAPATLDVTVADRNGRFVEGLDAGDFIVTVDGTRRPVLWVRRVSRGPGAAAEAASRADGSGGIEFAAELSRTVLVVVDQSSLLRGDERAIVQAAGLFMDRLGLNDRVAVVTLPMAPAALLSFALERAEVRAALARVTGRLEPAAVQAQAAIPTDASEQATMSGLKPEPQIKFDPRTGPASPVADAFEGFDTLRAMASLFDSLAAVPGRKVVAVFSAGLAAASGAQLDAVARAAAASRSVVLGFGARTTGGRDAGRSLTTAPLERLAAATGGTFARLGRDPARAVDAVVASLGACYVLGIGTAPDPGRTGRHRLEVVTARKGSTVRAPAWLTASPDPGDQVIAPAAAGGEPDATQVAGREPAAREAGDEAERLVVLARLFDYADGYERQYSMLVAEEDYRQSASAGGVHLKSDVLLVRPDESADWISFRDVFEVDGKPVRDREERLRRLFLDPSPDARARLEALGEESARYNIGWIERTVNVPPLPLSFLRAANRGRFAYELEGRDRVDGIEAVRVRYTEQARPTLIGDRLHQDVPVFGSFLVDAVTGAVVETRMNARRGDARAEIVVRYRADPALGLWVPAEMREKYSQPDIGYSGRSGLIRRAVVEGRATYSNFRRFQVTTGEEVKDPRK